MFKSVKPDGWMAYV